MDDFFKHLKHFEQHKCNEYKPDDKWDFAKREAREDEEKHHSIITYKLRRKKPR